jgi:carboxyvinyl-carboxyphosphonate phosphorylmutase
MGETMKKNDQRDRLRAILSGQRCVMATSVFDPISARIGDALNVEVGMMGGSVASFAVLGNPDLTLTTLTELAEQVRRVCRSSRLSLMVDADHGFGNALNVMRTIEELETAGAAAVTIEDTLLPRAYGATDATQLISLEEGVGKIKAAVRARADSGLLVMARTSATAITGIDDAVKRFVAYEKAGADVIFVPGLKKKEHLDRISEAVSLPLVLGTTGPALLEDPLYLPSRGVRIWFNGHHHFTAAVQAIYESAKAERLRFGFPVPEAVAPNALLSLLTQDAEHARYTADFLGGIES